MVKFRRLSSDELAKQRGSLTGERKRTRDEYKGYLEGLDGGEGGELQLQDEKKITVKNRLKRAAEDLNIAIEFKRSASDVVRFKVTESDS